MPVPKNESVSEKSFPVSEKISTKKAITDLNLEVFVWICLYMIDNLNELPTGSTKIDHKD